MLMGWRRAQSGETFAAMRIRMLHNVTLLFALMATPAVLISVSRAPSLGWRPFMAAHVGLLLAAWGLVWFSGRIAYLRHVGTLLLISLLASLIGYVELGPAADGKVLLISTAMLAALFLPGRKTWLVWWTVVLAVLALAVASILGWVQFEIDYPAYARNPVVWLNSLWSIALLAGVVVYVAGEMVTGLASNDARLRAMFNSMSEAIVVQDASGAAMQANRAAHQLLGLESQLRLHDASARTSLADSNGRPLALADLPGRQEALLDKPEPGCVLRLQRNDQVLHLRFQSTPMRSVKGGPVNATVTTVQDVTEQVEAQAVTEHALHATEAASRAKSDFLANVSHEIRTPMNAVIGMSHLLMGSTLDARQLGQVRKIRSAAEGLLGVLNDVLDFSKIESGHLQLELSRISLDHIVERVLSVVAPAVNESSLELTVEIEPAFPPALIGDSLRLTQVLVNLLSNAIKFTDQGGVHLALRCESLDDDRCEVQVRCEDTGVGISSDRLQSIFQPFTQADSSITRRFGGTGLGLSICARLIELMGGELQVSSQPGHGSCFSFRLQMARDPQSVESNVAQSLPSHDAVLIAGRARQDDIVQRYLDQIGLTAQRTPAGAKEAAEVVATRHQRPTLWLMNDELEDRGGRSWAEAVADLLQQEPDWYLLLISRSGERLRTHQLSPRLAVLESPVLPSALRRTIETVANASILAPIQASMPDLSKQQLLVVDDNAINREVVGEVLRRAGASVTYAGNGLQAVRSVRASTPATLPSLVLMDLQMPIMDGLQAARCIREHYSAERLPIVALTAHAMDEERERVLACGMQERLTKPVDPELLLQRIAFWLGISATRDATATEGPQAVAKAEAPEASSAPAGLRGLPGLNYAFGLKQVLGNEKLYRQMVGRFVERYAGTAKELLDAGPALRSQDNRRLIHSLKGMAATLGMESIAEQARQLEIDLDRSDSEVALVAGLQGLDQGLALLAAACRQESMPDRA
ncbi:hybrid sensor histidine kinase/response regulator [Pseudomarimonas arenosa]|uniref:histidine kinase n=1 Tax=Pseudomarimonas arenosa TaxID=2774145 RepID=A0AAW3ZLI8_9GAMM|nr:ATP-binding protein [Pseudomarimonas arenosa]MBD8526029.1 response regulator [Pseudomarimonas arenosa]